MAMNRRGVTLTELMIAVSLTGLLFASAGSVYVSATSFLNEQRRKWERTRTLIAMEHMVRRIGLANAVVIGPDDDQIKVRWDYVNDRVPLGTPGDVTDDTWLKYRFIGNGLRWRVEANPAPDVQATDPEVDPGLVVDPALSFFSMTNPPGPTGPPTVDIRLSTTSGTPPQPSTLHAAALLRSMPEN